MDRFHELEVFIAVNDAGSFAKAGQRLRMSPPAVTRAISALEDRLGARLFQRTTRRLAITDVDGRFTFRNLPAGSYLLRTDFGGIPASAARGLLGRRITVPATGPIVLDDLSN